jgi:hypothetical protein
VAEGRRLSPTVVLTAKRASSRPDLLRQISGVVANKPNSNKRRESLRRISISNLAAASYGEFGDGDSSDTGGGNGGKAGSSNSEISSSDDDEVIDVLDVTSYHLAELGVAPDAGAKQRSTGGRLHTIDSVRNESTSHLASSTSTGGLDVEEHDDSDDGGAGGSKAAAATAATTTSSSSTTSSTSSSSSSSAAAAAAGRTAGAEWAARQRACGAATNNGNDASAAVRQEGQAAGAEHSRAARSGGEGTKPAGGVSFGQMDFSSASLKP